MALADAGGVDVDLADVHRVTGACRPDQVIDDRLGCVTPDQLEVEPQVVNPAVGQLVEQGLGFVKISGPGCRRECWPRQRRFAGSGVGWA